MTYTDQHRLQAIAHMVRIAGYDATVSLGDNSMVIHPHPDGHPLDEAIEAVELVQIYGRKTIRMSEDGHGGLNIKLR